jgi:hypothetical protein
MEESLIAVIDVFQVLTRKFLTFIAELHFLVQKQFTSLLEKSTRFISRSATIAISHSHSFLFDTMFHAKVTTTNSTNHTTWRYKFLLQVVRPSTG